MFPKLNATLASFRKLVSYGAIASGVAAGALAVLAGVCLAAGLVGTIFFPARAAPIVSLAGFLGVAALAAVAAGLLLGLVGMAMHAFEVLLGQDASDVVDELLGRIKRMLEQLLAPLGSVVEKLLGSIKGVLDGLLDRALGDLKARFEGLVDGFFRKLGDFLHDPLTKWMEARIASLVRQLPGLPGSGGGGFYDLGDMVDTGRETIDGWVDAGRETGEDLLDTGRETVDGWVDAGRETGEDLLDTGRETVDGWVDAGRETGEDLLDTGRDALDDVFGRSFLRTGAALKAAIPELSASRARAVRALEEERAVLAHASDGALVEHQRVRAEVLERRLQTVDELLAMLRRASGLARDGAVRLQADRRITPTALPVQGGVRMRIVGRGFTPDTLVEIGGRLATDVAVSLDGSSLYATTPAGVPGPAEVVVFGATEEPLRYSSAVYYVDGAAALPGVSTSGLVALTEILERARAASRAGLLDPELRKRLRLQAQAARARTEGLAARLRASGGVPSESATLEAAWRSIDRRRASLVSTLSRVLGSA